MSPSHILSKNGSWSVRFCFFSFCLVLYEYAFFTVISKIIIIYFFKVDFYMAFYNYKKPIYVNLWQESAKLRALRAKNVLTCQRALRAHVPTCLTCQRALRAYVLTCLACLCAHVPTGLACLRANVPCGLTCSRALRVYVLTCQCALRAYVLTCQRALRAYVLTCFAC